MKAHQIPRAVFERVNGTEAQILPQTSVGGFQCNVWIKQITDVNHPDTTGWLILLEHRVHQEDEPKFVAVELYPGVTTATHRNPDALHYVRFFLQTPYGGEVLGKDVRGVDNYEREMTASLLSVSTAENVVGLLEMRHNTQISWHDLALLRLG